MNLIKKTAGRWLPPALWILAIILIAKNGEAATIEGRVQDPFGGPVPGITLTLGVDWGSSTPRCKFKTSAKTSKDGRFSFSIPCLLDKRPFNVSPKQSKQYRIFPFFESGVIGSGDTISGLEFEGVNLSTASHITRLLKPDQSCPSSPRPDRVPLILIHQHDGTTLDQDLRQVNSQWDDFRNFFYDQSLCVFFDLYVFQYYSNLQPVKELAGALQFWLSREGIQDKQKILLGHSMGGLVGWSYLNEWGGDSSTLGLLTLATPFHGTQAANEVARDTFVSNYLLPTVSKPTIELIKGTIDIIDLIKWEGFPNSVTKVNRSDLRYDNYDCFFVVKYRGKEVNTWLRDLNNVSECAQNSVALPQAAKVFPYAGYITFDDPNRPEDIIEDFTEALKTELNAFFESGLRGKDFGHNELAIINGLMGHGLGILYNDGAVPVNSALFFGQVQSDNQRIFPNCDHFEIKDETNGTRRGSTPICRDNQGRSVFGRLEQDLLV
ncbi:MAG: hypothetical protein Q8S00_11215 [Deltaproteobacteria bacterium]|nr:hypothetical protein [Deltaproteobacteria bacterium]